MLQIIQVSPTTIEATDKVKIDIPAIAYVGIEDGEIVGSGGLAWGGGRCWLWLRISTSRRHYGLAVMHRMKALLAKAWQLGEREVFTPRDADYPTSEKLLTVLGFRLFAVEEGVEVWRYERL
jgi:hypothetical protein